MYQSPGVSDKIVPCCVCVRACVPVCVRLRFVQTGRDPTPKAGGSAGRRTDGLPHGG